MTLPTYIVGGTLLYSMGVGITFRFMHRFEGTHDDTRFFASIIWVFVLPALLGYLASDKVFGARKKRALPSYGESPDYRTLPSKGAQEVWSDS